MHKKTTRKIINDDSRKDKHLVNNDNIISMALVVTNVEAIIKNINNKKTISVMDAILNSGVTLFRPLIFILDRFV